RPISSEDILKHSEQLGKELKLSGEYMGAINIECNSKISPKCGALLVQMTNISTKDRHNH
ncbi:9929_t:CDS:2, partial [Cetraspora pellucida]